MKIKSSAPGKILLLGGYSVLERPNVAYVLAVDSYVHAIIEPLKNNEVFIKIPQFKTEIRTTISGLYEEKNEKAKFVLAAVTTTLDYFKSKNINYSGFKLMTKSDSGFSVDGGKSGLGSSAAVTVATIAALFKLFGKYGLSEIHKISQAAHAKAQNKAGSGFDIAAACYGSIKYTRFSPQLFAFDNPALLNTDYLDCKITPISFPPNLKLVLASFPNQSMATASAVSKAMDFKKSNPRDYQNFMSEINIANENAIKAIELKDMQGFSRFFETGRALTKNFGNLANVEIESHKMSRLIEDTKKNGAFIAKLPGAGGGDSIVAICLGNEDIKRVKKFWKKNGLKVMDLKIINNGVTYSII